MSSPRNRDPGQHLARNRRERIEVPDFLGDHQLRDLAAGALYPLCRYVAQGASLEDLLEARDRLDCLIDAETAKRSLR